MRVGLLFPHDPGARPPGIDLARLAALARGLRALAVTAHILAPVGRAGRLEGLPVRPLAALREAGAYDLVKTCYHQAIFLAEGFEGPLVARLVRVVDQRHPARDQARRRELLSAQEAIARRAQALAFNNRENQERWHNLYGANLPSVLTPTGCPRRLPGPGDSPFGQGPPAVVYAGSLASSRQVEMLNRLARALEGRARIHLLGRNKSGLYGRALALSPLVADHGEKPPRQVWNYLAWAAAGLALAVGPEPFDNDSSKVVHYLRAGLPVLCEAPILQGPLVGQLAMGRLCPHGQAGVMARTLLDLLDHPPPAARRRAARGHMARHCSWPGTARVYVQLFARLLGQGPTP